MGYDLDAVIGSRPTVQAAMAAWPSATIVALTGDLVLAPLTDELADTISVGSPAVHDFRILLPRLAAALAAASHIAPVAYVEADFFGGVGSQRAAIWSAGVISLGPLFLAENAPWPDLGTPISRVLAALGVRRTGDLDEFDVAGLRRHRHT